MEVREYACLKNSLKTYFPQKLGMGLQTLGQRNLKKSRMLFSVKKSENIPNVVK